VKGTRDIAACLFVVLLLATGHCGCSANSC